MAMLNKLEFVPFGPYRFIGKSVYARGGVIASIDKNTIFGDLGRNSDWVFDVLDTLKEYATDETHKAALMTWEKYDDKNKLLGYTVGKFMKADTPVPDGMDYIDIPATYVAKGWFSGETDDVNGNAERMTKEAVRQQETYAAESWRFMAEVYPKGSFHAGGTLAGQYADSEFGYYIACSRNSR